MKKISRFIIGIVFCAILISGMVQVITEENLVSASKTNSTHGVTSVFTKTSEELVSPISTPVSTEVPLPTPTAVDQQSQSLADEQVCDQPHGDVIPGQVNSSLLDSPLNFQIYLPPCYDPGGNTRYPVLFLLHGMHNNESQWLRMDVNGIADSLILSKQVAPFLIVLPREDDTLSDPNTSNFTNEIVNVLVPYVDSHFATCSDRSCRAIGGLSRGSGWALRLGMTNWNIFGSIGTHSITPFFGDLYRLPDWINQIPSDQRPRLFIDIGSADDALQFGVDADSILTGFNFDHEWEVFDGGHTESYWHSHIKDYLLWYSQPWSEPVINSADKHFNGLLQ